MTAEDHVCGADGCPAGWLAVTMPVGAPNEAQAHIAGDAGALMRLGAPVAIDIPIGLTERPEDGARPADRAARSFLSARNADGMRGVGSRVFATPSRSHLQAFRAGCDYAAFRDAFPPPRSLSKQCWNICGKIAEVDDLCRADPELPLFEAHPEVAFAHAAGRTLPPKKSSTGAAMRRALLTRSGFDVDALGAMLPGKGWAPDDLMDAAILALTACRIATGQHAGLPSLAARDRQGLRSAIVY